MHEISRRRFCACVVVGGGYLGLAGCSAGPRSSAPTGQGSRLAVPREALASVEYGLTLDRFRKQVGTTFTLRTPTGSVHNLTLAEVHDLGTSWTQQGAGGESFNCHFTAAATTNLPQDTYQMSHAVLGAFAIFLVPGSRLAPGGVVAGPPEYVASFNRG